mmetsp:Transcript_101739/g.294416  ORF Transcript_101739/g.294416 Transcript_101739/m.294416 type:complete len:218 (+) Transcript_101739:1248-1901(+)
MQWPWGCTRIGGTSPSASTRNWAPRWARCCRSATRSSTDSGRCSTPCGSRSARWSTSTPPTSSAGPASSTSARTCGTEATRSAPRIAGETTWTGSLSRRASSSSSRTRTHGGSSLPSRTTPERRIGCEPLCTRCGRRWRRSSSSLSRPCTGHCRTTACSWRATATRPPEQASSEATRVGRSVAPASLRAPAAAEGRAPSSRRTARPRASLGLLCTSC